MVATREEILINVTPQETRVAVTENGVVQEIHIERASHVGLVGNVYFGQVRRVLPGMQSAFIDVGLERAAFLHVADIRRPGVAPGSVPIEQLLQEGQSLMVQVLKDPLGTKGARLTTQISLAGRFLVFIPGDDHIGVSQRIEGEQAREAQRARLQSILEGQVVSDALAGQDTPSGGYIIRTNAELASDSDLAADVAYLRRLWAEVDRRSRAAAGIELLHHDLRLPLRVLRDMVWEETRRIVVDSRETHQRMIEFAQLYTPATLSQIEHYSADRPLFDLYRIEEEIERALGRRVDLKSGGYLIIDQTEALTTVDVNTGGFVGNKNFDETVFKTNLEAAQVIARQLRLRNLGGIVIIDFIDMDLPEHREAVLAELQRAVSRDRMRIGVNGFTQQGLVEITRKRTRESLAHVLCEQCPTCQGRGEIKTAQTVCYEILREVVRELRQFKPREFRIIAGQQVVDLFLDEESPSLAQLEEFVQRPVSLQVETTYSQEQYDIVLL
ncbi:MAG: ribonuclease G [Rhodocyclaceae bacterium]|nr:ribonuclease G [Rhodocyclaceae bacterium]